jgi:hypothetical protein
MRVSILNAETPRGNQECPTESHHRSETSHLSEMWLQRTTQSLIILLQLMQLTKLERIELVSF